MRPLETVYCPDQKGLSLEPQLAASLPFSIWPWAEGAWAECLRLFLWPRAGLWGQRPGASSLCLVCWLCDLIQVTSPLRPQEPQGRGEEGLRTEERAKYSAILLDIEAGSWGQRAVESSWASHFHFPQAGLPSLLRWFPMIRSAWLPDFPLSQ